MCGMQHDHVHVMQHGLSDRSLLSNNDEVHANLSAAWTLTNARMEASSTIRARRLALQKVVASMKADPKLPAFSPGSLFEARQEAKRKAIKDSKDQEHLKYKVATFLHETFFNAYCLC